MRRERFYVASRLDIQLADDEEEWCPRNRKILPYVRIRGRPTRPTQRGNGRNCDCDSGVPINTRA